MVELYCVGGAIVAIFCYGYVLDKKIVKNHFVATDEEKDTEQSSHQSVH